MTRRPEVEGEYIPQARRLVTAQRLKDKAITEEREAKLSCASHMNSSNITEFSFRMEPGEPLLTARLSRPHASRLSVRKLYTLLANQEISLDDFLDCVVVSEKRASEILPSETVSYLKEDYRKGLDLIIETEEG